MGGHFSIFKGSPLKITLKSTALRGKISLRPEIREKLGDEVFDRIDVLKDKKASQMDAKKKFKDQLLAVLLSLLLPGLGQVYSSKVKKGVIIFLFIVFLGPGTAAYILNPKIRVSPYCLLFITLFFGLVIYAAFDAYICAKKHNLTLGLVNKVAFVRKIMSVAAILAVLLLYCLGIPVAASMFWRLYKAPPDSMEPTIYKGEVLIVDMRAYKKSGPKRGDVVIYSSPEEPKEVYLHRIVGLPGESIELKDQKIIINKAKLTDGWAIKVWHYNGGKLARRGMKPIDIPQDAYFVLGDSAARSRDSRYWGCLPKKYLIGKVYKICYPFNRSGPFE